MKRNIKIQLNGGWMNCSFLNPAKNPGDADIAKTREGMKTAEVLDDVVPGNQV